MSSTFVDFVCFSGTGIIASDSDAPFFVQFSVSGA